MFQLRDADFVSRLLLVIAAATSWTFAAGCQTRSSEPRPLGDWTLSLSGTGASIDWKLYESETNSGGRCLALDFSTPPHTEWGTDVDQHDGKLPACAPDPETTNDRITFFDWNEMVLDAVVDNDGRVVESDVEATSDAFHFIYGRTTADIANLAAIFDDGSNRDVPSKSQNFALVYERDLRLVALAWRSGDRSTKCELSWPDAVPSLEGCSAEPDE